MPYLLNDNIKNLVPYEPIAGKYEVRLDANESFLQLPFSVIQKAVTLAIDHPSNRYPDPYADALCRSFGAFYGVNPDCVTAGNGSDELISLIAGAFFAPGQEMITLAQDFSMYRFYGDVFGVKTSIYPKRSDLTIDVDGLIYYAKLSRAQGILFSNPCNPTSICLKKEEVLRLVRSVDCLVVVDEAYMDFADESVLDSVSAYDNLIVLKTASKAVGLAAIRLGFAVAGETLTRALRAVKSPYNVNAITQSVGAAVYAEQEYINSCIEKIIRSRDCLYNGVMSLYARYNVIETVYPTTTNFVYFKAKAAKLLFEELLDRSIAIRCMGDYLRISAGAKEENEAVLNALEEIMKKMEEAE